MKKLLPFLFLIAQAVFAASATPVNGIVAIVNDGVVTQSQLDNAIQFEKMRIRGANIPVPSNTVLRHQAMQALVVQTAALQMAQKNNLTIPEAAVNHTIQMVAENNHSTVPQLFAHIKQYGISKSNYIASVKDNLIIRKLEQQAIASNILVTPDEIDNYLAAQKKLKKPNEQYNLAHILIALPANPTPVDIQKAQAKANRVYADIQKGLSFQSAAVKYSDSGDASTGGVLGYKPLSLLPTLFVKAAQTLKTGSVSKPFKSPTGFHIVKLLGKQSSKAQKHFVTQYNIQKIVIDTSPIMSSQRAHAILNNLKTALANGKSFAKLARENSQDTLTATNGGKTGWETTSNLGESFAAVAARLHTGEVSQPFRTKTGWALIKLIGKRQKDDTASFEREQAANAIFQKKAMEAVNTWRAELKGQSYIKIMNKAE